MKDATRISGAKIAAAMGEMKGISTLNAVNMLGYTNDTFDIALGKKVWSGTTYSDSLHTVKWTMPIRDWGSALNQFAIIYGSRVPL